MKTTELEKRVKVKQIGSGTFSFLDDFIWKGIDYAEQ